jgi:hypothetical protein
MFISRRSILLNEKRATRTDPDAGGIEAAQTAVLRFSTLGVAAVAAILATGMVNAWFLAWSADPQETGARARNPHLVPK